MIARFTIVVLLVDGRVGMTYAYGARRGYLFFTYFLTLRDLIGYGSSYIATFKDEGGAFGSYGLLYYYGCTYLLGYSYLRGAIVVRLEGY